MSAPKTSPDPLATVRVEVLGRTDYMEAEQLATIRELPNYLAAEGIASELFFREPGGMGPAPIESIALFIAEGVGMGVIGGAAWAATTGAVKWARERIRREPADPAVNDEPVVSVVLYGPKGELLKHIDVKRDTVVDHESD